MTKWYPLSKLIAPVFLSQTAIASSPEHILKPKEALIGNNRFSPISLSAGLTDLKKIGINSYLVYPLADKNNSKTELEELEKILTPDNFLYKALAGCRCEHSDSLLMVDLCTCHFIYSGQCGIQENGVVSNQSTIEFFQRFAPLLAQAGARALCVSSMMDGAVQAVRHSLDDSGFADTLIVSQSAKLHSGYYGPFQILGGGLKSHELKKSYQVEPMNAAQMIRELELDHQEGADMAVLKPVSQSLDIMPEIRRRSPIPLLGYTTGGEYLMLSEALPANPFDRLLAINQYFSQLGASGLTGMISYFAQEYAQLRVQFAIK